MSAASPPSLAIGGVWRRIAAALLDIFIIAILAMFSTMPFFEPLSHLGAWGRLLGFCLVLPYFATLNSKIGNGQTLGKRVLSLRVVDREGEPISLPKSIVRYTVLSAPFFLNMMILPVTRTPEFVTNLVGFIVFGLGFLTIYLILFNRHTRQGTHDLLVGSYVVDSSGTGILNVPRVWKGHWFVFGLLLLAGVAGGEIVQEKVRGMIDLPAMMGDIRLIEEIPGVQAAGIRDWIPLKDGAAEDRVYVVTVFWSGDADRQEELADKVAKLVLENDPHAMSRNSLRILIVRGYDLGIARAQVTKAFVDAPTVWKQNLKLDSPQSTVE